MKKREGFENISKRMETASEGVEPLTEKEVEKLLRSGDLTEEQALELYWHYMDSLEYKEGQQFVTCCGGIRPLPILPPPDEEI